MSAREHTWACCVRPLSPSMADDPAMTLRPQSSEVGADVAGFQRNRS